MAEHIYGLIPKNNLYERIGIYCNDDVYTYAAILAVNFYGAAYIPLNSKFPIARNKNIVEECELELILTSGEENMLTEVFDGIEIVCSHVEPFGSNQDKLSRSMSGSNGKLKQIIYKKVNQPTAYILFTSGSTGEPKGVPVSHENVKYFFDFYFKEYDFTEQDNFLQVYELTFDVSVFSFFMPLFVGACCYVLPENGIKPMKIIEYLQKHKITTVSMVPTVLNYLKNYLEEILLPDLRFSFFSGDSLYQQLAVKWKKCIPNAKIHNFYGPTETTIVCTRYVFNEKLSETESVNEIVPLGKAFEGMEILIVDENNQPIEKGELCFSGKQVIESYLNKVNEDSFFYFQEKCYYKTGDIVSVNTLGNLIFYGRKDNQVKVNGFRIELTEVEFAISKITGCNCLVIAKADKNKINCLIAFVESKKYKENNLTEILSSVLPEYMIPQQFIFIDKMELNVNGKFDKGALINSYL